MGDSPGSSEALPLLGEVYRLRRTGVFSIELEEPPLGLVIREGDVVGFVPSSEPAPVPEQAAPNAEEPPPDPEEPAPNPEAPAPNPEDRLPNPEELLPAPEDRLPDPEDSTRLKLDRVLVEVGIRKAAATRPKKTSPPPTVAPKENSPPPAPAPTSTDAGELRDRLVTVLATPGTTASFEETEEPPEDLIPTASPVEPLILEAVRRLDPEQVTNLLGNLDQRLVATAALAEQQRTLTLNEGYLLSRVDGQCSAREILQLVPGQPGQAEATLAGLLLTGRLAMQEPPAPKPRTARPAAEPEAKPEPPPSAPDLTPPPPTASQPQAATPPGAPPPDAPPPDPKPPSEGSGEGAPAAEKTDLTPEQTAERNQILELFQALPLRNHYEILGVKRKATDAEIKAAHVALIKRYHPDMRREKYLEELHDVLEAIFIRVGQAWEVLGNAKSRAAYEQELGRSSQKGDGSGKGEAEKDNRPVPEEILRQAQFLVGKKSYGDAVSMLESGLPHFESEEHQHAGRILLARAYSQLAGSYTGADAKKWVNRAMEILQGVLAEDGQNASAFYELGMVYKRHGMTARAQAMFKKALEAEPSHRRARAELSSNDDAPREDGGFLRKLFGGGRKQS